MIEIAIGFVLAMITPTHLMPKSTSEPVLILNMANTPNKLPHHFRICDGPFIHKVEQTPSRLGLDQLRISGSAQFSKEGFLALYEKIQAPALFIDVDLRQESHGFIDGNAISWYAPRDWANKGKSHQEIEQDEKSRLESLTREKAALFYQMVSKDKEDRIDQVNPLSLLVNSAYTESQLMQNLNHGYKRFFIPDHVKPSDEEVDLFIQFILGLKPSTWLHFHCAGGDGRTTTFMAMRDMMVNSNQVSLKDIIDRQWLLGGIELSFIPPETLWKSSYAKERYEFLKKFYTYSQIASKDNFTLSWSQYIK